MKRERERKREKSTSGEKERKMWELQEQDGMW